MNTEFITKYLPYKKEVLSLKDIQMVRKIIRAYIRESEKNLKEDLFKIRKLMPLLHKKGGIPLISSVLYQ